MNTATFKTLAAVMAGALLLSCGGDSADRQAGELLRQARAQYEKKEYGKALATIDTLRKTCPEAIEARRQALRLFQEVELSRARQDLEAVDSQLTRAGQELSRMEQEVGKAKAEGKATAGQLTALTRKRMERDSLQTRFDMQCAKIKYIHKKQKE